MCVKRKLRRQFGTSRGLFQTYLSEFRWRNFHRWLIWCITWYNYIIFCPTDCVTILFHVFCQYTTFKIALIIYAAIVVGLQGIQFTPLLNRITNSIYRYVKKKFNRAISLSSKSSGRKCSVSFQYKSLRHDWHTGEDKK